MKSNLTPPLSIAWYIAVLCCCMPFISVKANTTPPNVLLSNTARTYVEFSIINDLGEDYPFFLGGPNLIAKGTTRTFNYPEGTDIFHLSNEQQKGKEWFTVNPDMQRQTYTLSQFIRDNQ